MEQNIHLLTNIENINTKMLKVGLFYKRDRYRLLLVKRYIRVESIVENNGKKRESLRQNKMWPLFQFVCDMVNHAQNNQL